MQPDQASFLLQNMLPKIGREHNTTKTVLQAIPADKTDYRPDEFAKPALDLAWHIAATEHRFMQGAISGVIDFKPQPRPDSTLTPEGLVTWYTETIEADLAQLKALDGEALAKMLDFRGMMQLPAVDLLDLMLRHSVHHRGQLSVYLRPMGSKVPAIYGESYDSAQARLAREAGKP